MMFFMDILGSELLKVLRQAAGSKRDEWLIILGATLGLDSGKLRNLTLRQAVKGLVRYGESGRGLSRSLARWAISEGFDSDGLLFRSRTYGGRLNRVTVWRIINGAARRAFGSASGGTALLKRLHVAIRDRLLRTVEFLLGVGHFWVSVASNKRVDVSLNGSGFWEPDDPLDVDALFA